MCASTKSELTLIYIVRNKHLKMKNEGFRIARKSTETSKD